MSVRTLQLGGLTAVAWEGAPIASERDASDLVGEALSAGAQLVLMPAERLGPDFLRLSSGLAGAVLQKLVNYGLKAVVVGDISGPAARSLPLADFVRESNRGRHVWFVPDLAALEAKLAAP
jgi:hypothetical protein